MAQKSPQTILPGDWELNGRLFVGGAFTDRSLSSGEAGYRDSERGATHVVEADVDGFWFSAVSGIDILLIAITNQSASLSLTNLVVQESYRVLFLAGRQR
ncbi:hypothetical protein MCEMSE15_01574 [Fimbriimonadaceae bacterium]